MRKFKGLILVLVAALALGLRINSVLAQDSGSVLYVPLIGISSVPKPLTLPNGPGNVTYQYAVKNFLSEVALSNITVVDDKCSPVKFVGGDDNNDSKLYASETWRYSCTTELSVTTDSVATATGTISGILATHSAYATVIVGIDNTPPLVNIINISKVAYPLTLPSTGGDIIYTYRVNNPGIVPLGNVSVTDDKCATMSNKLGDTNANNLLDINEVWIYTCTAHLNQTTTNTASVTAYANGLKAIGFATLSVKVDTSDAAAPTNLFDIGISPDAGAGSDLKISVWKILSAILAILVVAFILFRKIKRGRILK